MENFKTGKPRFSVITVCWNEADRIRETCASVCMQDFVDFEWVVVDGGSTDGTLAVLQEYEQRMACFISEPDDGIYNAMNKGLRHARGEYVVFMNGGDTFADSDVLSEVSKVQTKDLIYGDLKIAAGSNGESIREYPSDLSEKYLLSRMLPHQASFFSAEPLRGLWYV